MSIHSFRPAIKLKQLDDIRQKYLKQSEQIEKPIDKKLVQDIYFQCKKEEKEVTTQNKTRLSKIMNQNQGTQGLGKKFQQKDAEDQLKLIFAQKNSYLVPFREDPYNKFTATVKFVSPSNQNFRRKKVQSFRELKSRFSPQCSIVSIINPEKVYQDRRLMAKNKEINKSILHLNNFDPIERLQRRFEQTQKLSSHYPNVDIMKSKHEYQSQQDSQRNSPQTNVYQNYTQPNNCISTLRSAKSYTLSQNLLDEKNDKLFDNYTEKLEKGVDNMQEIQNGQAQTSVVSIQPVQQDFLSLNLWNNKFTPKKVISVPFKFEIQRRLSSVRN